MVKVSQTYEIWTPKSSKGQLIQKLRLAHHRPRITLQSIYHGSKYALRFMSIAPGAPASHRTHASAWKI